MPRYLKSNDIKKYREAYGLALRTLSEIMLSDIEETDNRIEAAEVVLVYMNPEAGNKDDDE